MAQPFDNRRFELTGQAAPVAEPIHDGRAVSASGNGVLVFRRNTQTIQPTWYSPDGAVLGTAGDIGFYRQVELSPDGMHAALVKGAQGQASSIWLLDLARGTSTRFGSGSASDDYPVWSPDGSRIIFNSSRDGAFNLYQAPANGAKGAELLLSSNEDKAPRSWSRDGRFLFYTVINPKTGNDLWVLPLNGDKKPFPFLATEFNEQDAQISPDGRWVAYASNESGKFEIYVRPFSGSPNSTAVEAGGKWTISTKGGVLPKWRSDGRELYYQALDQKMMAVEITASPAFRAGEPRPLGLVAAGLTSWDSTPDGKRFLVNVFNPGKPEPYRTLWS